MYTSSKKISYENLTNDIFSRESQVGHELMIIIPSFAESNILKTLDSVLEASMININVGLLVLINEGYSISQELREINEKSYDAISSYDPLVKDIIKLYCLYVTDIPDRWAGVGMARKLAIDQSLSLISHPSVPIVNLDADCIVATNYIHAVQQYFSINQKVELANIYFEHEISQNTSDQSIIEYEGHLRYFLSMQRWLGLPYAFHTVGSSFAIRANAYKQVGGMNKRKAGEDFYFIHKFTKKGTIGEIGNTSVYPSSRISERVPFGTGRAMKHLTTTNSRWLTYHPQNFIYLRSFFQYLPIIYLTANWELSKFDIDKVVLDFLELNKAHQTIIKLKANVKSYNNFLKSFFQWFDAFLLMKYLHYAREHGLPDLIVNQAISIASDLLSLPSKGSNLEYLEILRERDNKSSYQGITESLSLYPQML